MDYKYCDYKGRYVLNAKDYLNAIRNNCFSISYDHRNRKKMIEEIETLIDFNSSVDLYAFARLLYDENDKYGITRCSSILDIIASWNYVPGKYLLGQLYFYGLVYEKDLNMFYSLTLDAANANFIPAKNALALAYLYGYGCKINVDKGLELLKECMNANYSISYHNIGHCYFTGDFGYPKDAKKALEYFEKAASGYYVKGCYNAGLMYLRGEGCSKNTKKALEYLIQGAYLGDVKAQKLVADAYYFGEGIPKNLDSAYEFYLMAAELGDAYCMYSVGFMIVKKEKANIDKFVGINWLSKAHRAGYEKAMDVINKL